ncbi:MAG: cytochrome c [Rhodanobacteraceae bacterium]
MIGATKHHGHLLRSMIGVAGWLLMAGATAQPADDPILGRADLAHASGEQIYLHICQGCHMSDARGASGAGTYPALAADAHLASAQYAAAVVLNGRRDMPSFLARPDLRGFEAMVHLALDDAQIAAVVNYVRSHFGNHYTDPITAADVRALHVSAGNPR